MKLFKKLNKGFTLVELVVVIAVIAILSAVSVAAYSGITEKARQSAALSEAKARYNEVFATDMADGVLDLKEGTTDISETGYAVGTGANSSNYVVTNWEASNDYKCSFSADHVWTVAKPGAGA